MKGARVGTSEANLLPCYHVTFSPHGRIGALWDEIEEEFNVSAREAGSRWGFTIHAMAAMPDHVHVLIEKSSHDELSKVVQLLKGITSRRIGERFPELKLDMHSNHFWQKGYHYTRHDDSSLNAAVHYIENQKKKAGLTE
ncbi:MAG: IS200/IS605 family transposase [Dehalococcoidia bacterium]|nr:IS200/IS605 family transposase [Dehalococcoidia bacterium]